MELTDGADDEAPKINEQKGEPFEGIDMTWQNGSDRRTNNIWKDLKYFTPNRGCFCRQLTSI